MSEHANQVACPKCGSVVTHRCRPCSLVYVETLNGVVIWTRHNRIAYTFENAKAAWVETARLFNISESTWPEQYRSA